MTRIFGWIEVPVEDLDEQAPENIAQPIHLGGMAE